MPEDPVRSGDAFVHLHVASGYSLQYGASHPHVLVERAAEQEMDTLALTDRDGVYGAVKFVKACRRAGVRPVLGVDLAYLPRQDVRTVSRPTPVRGGAFREPRLPRVTLLATGKAGWAALCRLVSSTHLSGERGCPVTTVDLVAEYAAAGDLLVLLGPTSEVGAAATLRRPDLAGAALAPWREAVPAENLLLEVVSHRLPGSGPGSSPHAARMTGIAREAGLGAMLSNAVRYADRLDAPVVDVLDAARRLVPLGSTDLRRSGPTGFRTNAEGFLKSGKQMAEVAEEICRHAGLSGNTGQEARRLLAHTRVVADRCVLDPREDLGMGEVHFPELDLASGAGPADALLRSRCEAAIGDRYGSAPRMKVWTRLDRELEIIRELGYASYFLTVGDVTDLIREMGVRCAARGSGAGSLVNYLLGISGVDPLRYGLLMERFLSPLRESLPDIDVDVESARRLEVYEAILKRYGGERCVCVSMMDTYRVRHAVRDVGAALGMPPGEIDAIAKAFPHIRARDARTALRELPELRAAGLAHADLDLMFGLVERLDGLPRHIAVHPCGVLLSDATLLDRTPVEASYAGFPMSQFDKDDVEDLGLLKLDVLGIRMQSAMAHAVAEVKRVDGREIDLDDEEQVPFDDPSTFRMISEARTLGVFQIESPGQRELVGKSGIESFEDIITDISLFRPGPVKSDMVTPYLEAKQGWKNTVYPHPHLRPILEQTHGVVVFHEQVIELIAQFAGVSNAVADERRRALGDPEWVTDTRLWFHSRALGRGYPLPLVERVWKVLEAFASFGFCKAHAAAFALPTYQSAWLKAHHPAHFLAGVLTHDPGMYPKRLILDDARQFGIAVLGLDVNTSGKEYLVEALDPGPPAYEEEAGGPRGVSPRAYEEEARGPRGVSPRAYEEEAGGPRGVSPRAYGIRIALAEVKGISEGEVDRILAARPFGSLTDFWHRARVSRPVVERLVLAGGFDSIHGIGEEQVRRRGQVTRRDLLLQVSALDQQSRLADRSGRGRGLSSRRRPPASEGRVRAQEASGPGNPGPDIRSRAAAQSRATRIPDPVSSVQLALDLDDHLAPTGGSGLPEMTPQERMQAELEVLGLDASRHVMESYQGFLDALGVTRSRDLLAQRSRSELLVAGVKVATQTPPIRSGRRVIFLTLDDATGPVDATFFEDVQGPYAATVFHSWLLVVRGELRRTGRRGVSLRATGVWELSGLHTIAESRGMAAVHEAMAAQADADQGTGSETVTGQRRVLVHTSGFRMSPYSDIRPAGDPASDAHKQGARKLWHRSPGSAG